MGARRATGPPIQETRLPWHRRQTSPRGYIDTMTEASIPLMPSLTASAFWGSKATVTATAAPPPRGAVVGGVVVRGEVMVVGRVDGGRVVTVELAPTELVVRFSGVGWGRSSVVTVSVVGGAASAPFFFVSCVMSRAPPP